MATISQILFLVLIPLCIFGLVAIWYFLRYMKSRHFAIWKSLGEPSLLLHNGMKNNLLLWRFLIKRDYRTSQDERFIRLSSFLRMYLLFYVVYFIIFVVLALVEA